MNSQQSIYEFGPFRVDAIKRVLWREGEPVQLTSKSFDTLLVLVGHRGEIVTKDDLIKALWPDTIVEENNLTQQISMLRKALGEKVGEHRYLVTVPGRGYSFVAEVRVADNVDLSMVPADSNLNRPGNRDMNLVLEQHISSRITVDVENQLMERPRHLPRRSWRSRVAMTGLASVLVLVLLGYGISWRRARLAESSRDHRRTDRSTTRRSAE